MGKFWFAVAVGGALGILDGLTSWFTPAVRAQLAGIVVGSTIKGAIAGAIAGWFAKKVNSVPLGILVGLIAGLLLAWGVAAMQHGYYFEIMLPGSLVGAIAGYAAQKRQEVSSLSYPCSGAYGTPTVMEGMGHENDLRRKHGKNHAL